MLVADSPESQDRKIHDRNMPMHESLPDFPVINLPVIPAAPNIRAIRQEFDLKKARPTTSSSSASVRAAAEPAACRVATIHRETVAGKTPFLPVSGSRGGA